MTQSTRESALASRHRTLGSALEDWNGMGTAWSYHTDPDDEHDAVREAAGLFDMSPLKKMYVRGADAEKVIDHVITRDMSVVYPGKSVYGAVLTQQGTVCDDAIVANNGNGEWMLCHGSGQSLERLYESAEGRDVHIEWDDDLHDISLQGPKALELLDTHASENLSRLKYFEHRESELFGHRCRISRTGYSGERGYEIFIDRSSVCDLWDNILGYGEKHGVKACSFTALDKVRIEAALLFFGYDMTDEHSPWEVGLGFTVSRKKADFRGREAAFDLEGKERFVLAGISADYGEVLAGGERLWFNGDDVGVVNSPALSRRMNKSLALVHLNSKASTPGTVLQISGEGVHCSAVVETIPFFDPGKTRTHS